MSSKLTQNFYNKELLLKFSGELTLYDISKFEDIINQKNIKDIKKVTFDLSSVTFLDTAVSIFILKLEEKYRLENIETITSGASEEIVPTLALVKKHRSSKSMNLQACKKEKPSKSNFQKYFISIASFFTFLGKLFMTKIYYLKSYKNIRVKEMIYEINESAIKAFGIVSLTSFLIGLVVAYQSAYQLKIYGANIFIVDMLGISILRELAPLITAIVIAGRSGSAFTAQIGAMKITQELDAMKTMGFDPYIFLVLPRVLALMIAMPILIFIADIMGLMGGMLISNIDLGITPSLFIDRFNEVVSAKHFFVGISKGPFFAFLIATIGIYRGLMVKNDTQSIGFNTTKSVVESIFAVIVCDALFSIAFTNLGI